MLVIKYSVKLCSITGDLNNSYKGFKDGFDWYCNKVQYHVKTINIKCHPYQDTIFFQWELRQQYIKSSVKLMYLNTIVQMNEFVCMEHCHIILQAQWNTIIHYAAHYYLFHQSWFNKVRWVEIMTHSSDLSLSNRRVT